MFFNQNQTMEIFQDFRDETMHDIDGGMGGRLGEVEEAEVYIGFPLSSDQVYSSGGEIMFTHKDIRYCP